MKWEAWKIEYVRANYVARPARDVAAHVGTSPAAVRKMAQRLQVQKSPAFIPPGNALWMAHEDAVLRDNFGTHTYAQIGALLGRSTCSVQLRAFRLGLCQAGKYEGAKEWTAEDDALLRACFPSGNIKELCQVMGRTPNSLCKRASRLGIPRVAVKPPVKPTLVAIRNTRRKGKTILVQKPRRKDKPALPSRPAINPGDVSVTLRPGFTVFCPPGQSVEEVRAKYAKYL